MNNKKLFWGGFFGAIALFVIVVAFIQIRNQNRMKNLAEFFSDWSTVSGKITQFEARMPGEPEYASQDLPLEGSDKALQQEIYVSGEKAMSYFISATHYPFDVEGEEEQNLRLSLDGVIKAMEGGELVSAVYKVPFRGANYLEFEAKSSQNSTLYKGRIYLVDRSLYQVYVSAPQDGYNDAAYTFFTYSFISE